MRERWKTIYNRSSLTTKIRYSYLLLLVPTISFLLFCFYNMWSANKRYEDMVNSAVMASEFSLDFKKDFDYETYLLIVGNKSVEESGLDDMLAEANRIVRGLEELTDSTKNNNYLESVKKYLKNLEIYKGRIEQNLKEGNRYEDNMEIWENDVQIVTSLLREAIIQYIYCEIKDMQQSHEQYQQFFVTMLRTSVVACIVIALVIIFLSYYIPLSISRPIRELSRVTDQVAKGNLTVHSDVQSGQEVAVLSDSLNTMIDKLNGLLHQVKTEQIRLRKAEFEVLQSQINPHFLYNTLDTIVWLAESGKQKEVVSMVGSLSEFFRKSLNQGKDIVRIQDEILHVKSYLEIQQVRYQDILQYEIALPDEIGEYLIPKITLQPLVENALYHGIKNKRMPGKITIGAKTGEDGFCITITDDGIGMTEERLGTVRKCICEKPKDREEVYGLYNVNERIRLNFGESYGITMESIYREGTVVCVNLPYIREMEELA